MRQWEKYLDDSRIAFRRIRAAWDHAAVACLQHWHEFTLSMEAARVAVARVRDHFACKVLRTWCDKAIALKDNQRALLRAVKAFTQAGSFKAFAGWRAAVVRAKEERAAEKARQAEMARALAQAAAEKEMEAARQAEAERQQALRQRMEAAAQEERERQEKEELRLQQTAQTPAPSASFGSALTPSARLVSFGAEMGTSDRVVILSARPKTVMSRHPGLEMDAALDVAFARDGSSRRRAVPSSIAGLSGTRVPRPRTRAASRPPPPWNSHLPDHDAQEINRRRVWSQTAANERAIASLRSGELPYDADSLPYGTARYSAQRAEERFYSTSARSAATQDDSCLSSRAGSGEHASMGGAVGSRLPQRRSSSFESGTQRRMHARHKAAARRAEEALAAEGTDIRRMGSGGVWDGPTRSMGISAVTSEQHYQHQLPEHQLEAEQPQVVMTPHAGIVAANVASEGTVAEYGHALIFHAPRPVASAPPSAYSLPSSVHGLGAGGPVLHVPVPSTSPLSHATPALSSGATPALSSATTATSLGARTPAAAEPAYQPTPRVSTGTVPLPGGGSVAISESLDGAIQLSVRQSPPR